MIRKTFTATALIIALSSPAGYALAAADASPPPEIRGTEEQQFYGSQLMTQEERVRYHIQMREAKTVKEQELLRREHHQRMQERAKVRGIILPEEPPANGGGMRMGPEAGRGNGNR